MRSIPAARSPRGKQPPDPQHRPRRGRGAFALAALAGIAFLVGACGGGGPASSSSTTTGGATSGTGVVIRSGSGSGSQSGNNTTTTGGYSVAFAGCMRAHGVPKFPNPNGSPNQLGPDSGVNPSSAAYQAALNGPCESVAPAGWVASGPVTKGGGS
jgi:hypothetical protein